MKLPLNWLKDYLKITSSVEDIIEALPNLGIEVDEVTEWDKLFRDLIIAQVTAVDPHPNADLLVVCQLRDKNDNTYNVVCGDKSIKAGSKVIYAADKSYIPAWNSCIASRTIRGVSSQGMICSLEELGMVNFAGLQGVHIFPDDTDLSSSVAEALAVDMPVLTLEITPNRSDCLSVLGIARELQAKQLGTMKAMADYNFYDKLTEQVHVNIEDTSCCYVYMGRIINGCNNNATLPHWMVDRLRSANIKSVNPLMDIVNYVSHVLGFPLQIFDLDQFSQKQINIHNLSKSEVVSTIGNGAFDHGNQNYISTSKQLPVNTLVMRNGSTIINVNGAFYNTNFMCSKNSKRIYLGAGYFNRDNLAVTNRLIGFNTDNSLRLERGVDFDVMKQALSMATKYIIDILNGDVGQMNINGEPSKSSLPIKLRVQKVNEILGIEIPSKLIGEYLKRLGFTISKPSNDIWEVTPPSWREDCNSDVDLIEEVARLHGYQHLTQRGYIKTTPECHAITKTQAAIEKITQAMVARGGHEVITTPFISSTEAQIFSMHTDYQPKEFKIHGANNAQQDTLRSSLLPGLLRCLNANIACGCEDLTLYETGMFFRDKGSKGQMMGVGIIRYGQHHKKYWGTQTRDQDVFDIRADLDAIIEMMGIKNAFSIHDARNVTHKPDFGAYVTGCSGFYAMGGFILAYFGLLNPEVCPYEHLKGQEVWMAELLLDNLLLMPKAEKSIGVLSPYPTVRRDFCVTLEGETLVRNVVRSMKDDENLPEDVDIAAYVFDYYISIEHYSSGKRSVTIGVEITPKKATLTDSEINAICDTIIKNLKSQPGVKLRE